MNRKEKIAAIREAFGLRTEKASDLDMLMAEVMKLPYGQLKKVLSQEVMTVLEKYGYR